MASKYPTTYTLTKVAGIWNARADGFTVCGAGNTADNAIRDWKRQRLKQFRRQQASIAQASVAIIVREMAEKGTRVGAKTPLELLRA